MSIRRGVSLQWGVALSVALVWTGAAAAQDGRTAPKAAKAAQSTPAAPSEGWMSETRRKAGEIASQPVRDLGALRTDLPEILVSASTDPYTLKGIRTCKQISAAVSELNTVLGPDFLAGDSNPENRAGRLAAAGGRTVVNSLLPFRGLVREVSGAAPAERRLKAAVDAGYARRGFLRGVHRKQGCRTGF